MSEVTRRGILQTLGLAAAAGSLTEADAQHVHQMAGEEKKSAGGVYKPKALTEHEYATVRTLCEQIVPGANAGGAPEFIDLLCASNQELASIYTGGLSWLDHQMRGRYGQPYAAARPEQQTAMLDLIAYRKNDTAELRPGIRFFDWIRRMTADAYYTSKPGIAELGFMGNKGMAKFEVPAEAIEYALKRSPV